MGWHYDPEQIRIPVFIVAGTAGEFEIETVIPFEKLTPELLRNPLYQDQRIDYYFFSLIAPVKMPKIKV